MSDGKCPAKHEWFFPDTYLPDITDNVSHESICVLNIGDIDATIEITLYFEDREPIGNFFALCPAKRTNHIRFDKIKSKEGVSIPQCTPYSVHILSDVPVMCQYTRVDATRPHYSLMTTMGL
jgi:hypothetical protein